MSKPIYNTPEQWSGMTPKEIKQEKRDILRGAASNSHDKLLVALKTGDTDAAEYYKAQYDTLLAICNDYR